MKKILVLISIIVTCLHLLAQPAAVPARGAGASIHILGKVTDSDGKPVADASVLVLQNQMDSATKKNKQILVVGATTAANGDFDLEGLPFKNVLFLKISSLGYKEYDKTISFTPGMNNGAKPSAGAPMAGGMGAALEKDLGKIMLAAEAKVLEGVTITAQKSMMKLDIDKKVFNVEKNIVSDGGTAVDVMKNVPSVNVDIDGNVTLRNSSPQVFVDGRPTTLTLDQIPANATESVEVMTNPSAKYDASGGGAGILNIVLKKNKKTGYNGTVRAGINKYGETDGGFDFNVRENKINFTGGINARAANGRSTSTLTRVNTGDSPSTVLNQINTDKNTGAMIFGRVGLDYFVTNKTTLSFSFLRMHGDIEPMSIAGITTDSMYNSGITSSYSERNTNSKRVFNGQGLVFGMKHLFTKKDEAWTVDANYFTGKGDNNSVYTTDNYLTKAGSSLVSSETQKIVGGGSDKNLILQSDYVLPLKSNTKLETGVRAAIRSRVNSNFNYVFDNTTNDYVLLPSAASNYKSNDDVYAAYGSLTSSINNFGYKLGLRAESSDYNGELTDTKQTFSNKYPISLFPSVFLSQKLKASQEFQFSYTRRINRPNFFQLIPFVDSTDKLNITSGNPALKPEFTQSFEVNYLKQFKGNNTLLASLYYKKTNNLITHYLQEQTNPVSGDTYLVNTTINANSSYSAGAEITLQNNLTKWWSASTDINIYNSKINADSSAQNAMWSGFAKLNNNFKLPGNFSLQLSAIYQSKTNLPVNTNPGGFGGGPPGMTAQSASQGYINPFYTVDAAVKKTFLNNKISASISINDIFKSRKQDQYSYSAYFTQEYNRIRDPQMVRLNLTYSFGKVDASLFKRKSSGTGQSGSEMQQ